MSQHEQLRKWFYVAKASWILPLEVTEVAEVLTECDALVAAAIRVKKAVDALEGQPIEYALAIELATAQKDLSAAIAKVAT